MFPFKNILLADIFQWRTLRFYAILSNSKEYYSCHLDMCTYLLFLMYSLSYILICSFYFQHSCFGMFEMSLLFSSILMGPFFIYSNIPATYKIDAILLHYNLVEAYGDCHANHDHPSPPQLQT